MGVGANERRNSPMSLAIEIRERSFEVLAPPARAIAVRARFEWHNAPTLIRDVRAALHLWTGDMRTPRLTHFILLPGYPRIAEQSPSKWEETIEFPLSS